MSRYLSKNFPNSTGIVLAALRHMKDSMEAGHTFTAPTIPMDQHLLSMWDCDDVVALGKLPYNAPRASSQEIREVQITLDEITEAISLHEKGGLEEQLIHAKAWIEDAVLDDLRDYRNGLGAAR